MHEIDPHKSIEFTLVWKNEQNLFDLFDSIKQLEAADCLGSQRWGSVIYAFGPGTVHSKSSRNKSVLQACPAIAITRTALRSLNTLDTEHLTQSPYFGCLDLLTRNLFNEHDRNVLREFGDPYSHYRNEIHSASVPDLSFYQIKDTNVRVVIINQEKENNSTKAEIPISPTLKLNQVCEKLELPVIELPEEEAAE